MAKSIVDTLRDDSPKMTKKINKMLENKKCSVFTKTYFDSFKAEVTSGSVSDFPEVKLVVTNSYIAFYDIVWGITLEIVPLSIVENVYRTNIIEGKYDYDAYSLQLELTEGRRMQLSRVLRVGNKNLECFSNVIEAVKSKKVLVAGGVEA